LGRKSTSNANDSFTGSLDEVRIWNTALDEATMDAWRNGELTNSHPNISDLQVTTSSTKVQVQLQMILLLII
jgi:hypothetical protein